ncbi:protein of unknown function DUF2313 [Sporosarcina phage Lietuvens]|nr:protein of unknown function DUF2313 [Sporosarcina phage Lietuvens]
MADITLGKNLLAAKADVNITRAIRLASATVSVESAGNARSDGYRISYIGFNGQASASVIGRQVRLQYVKTGVRGIASMAQSGRVAKYIRGRLNANAKVRSGSHRYKTVRGVLAAQATLDVFHGTRDTKAEMLGYMPKYYDDFNEVNRLMQTGANESTRIHAKVAEIVDQFYVQSATYGIERWGSITDVDTAECGNSSVLARLQRVGTITPTALKALVDTFAETQVFEEVSDFKIRLKIVGERGKPADYAEIERAVNDVVPAHLLPYFEFTYLPWGEVTASGMTWAQAKNYTAQGLEEAFLLPKGAVL